MRGRRAAVALVIAIVAGTVGVALASPESIPGGNPNVTLDVTPSDGDALPSPASITVIGAGFGSSTTGTIAQCALDPTLGFICSNTIGMFASSATGAFSTAVQVSSSFQEAIDNTTVSCAAVPCFVYAVNVTGQFESRHHISFATTTTTTSTSTTSTSSTSTTSTTTPTTSTSTSSTSTTAPTTTTTVPVTTTTVPVTTTTAVPVTTTTAVPVTTTTAVPVTTTTVPVTTTTAVPVTTTTTVPVTTTTAVPVTTTTSAPATTTTAPAPVTTTTILSARCAAILESQRRLNAQLDAAEAAIRRFVPAGPRQEAVLAQLAAARARYNALFAQQLATCSTGTPPPAITTTSSSTTPTTQAPTTTTTTPSDPCSGAERRLFNAQIDAAEAAFRVLLPPGPRLDATIAHFEAFRARVNALFDRLAGCT